MKTRILANGIRGRNGASAAQVAGAGVKFDGNIVSERDAHLGLKGRR